PELRDLLRNQRDSVLQNRLADHQDLSPFAMEAPPFHPLDTPFLSAPPPTRDRSSRAWVREASGEASPESIRASSISRSSPASRRARVVVRPSSTAFCRWW